MAFNFFFNATLSFLLLVFSAWTPSMLSLSTVAISETSGRTLICALRRTSNRESFLNCSGFPTEIQIPRLYSNISYSAIVAGDGFVCALRSFSSSSSSSSSVICWRFSSNGTVLNRKEIYKGQAIMEFDAGYSHYCGLVNATNRLLCWPWHQFNKSISAQALNFSSIAVGDGFVCGLSELGMIRCVGNNSSVVSGFPRGKYCVISAGYGHACALTPDDDLHCWGDVQGQNIPQTKFKFTALGENRGCGLLANDTVICWGRNNFRLPESLQDSCFVHIEAKRNIFCGIMKGNCSLICWGNHNFDSNFMVFEDVVPGSSMLATSKMICSQRYISKHCFRNSLTPPPPGSRHLSPQASPPPFPSPAPSSGGSNGWSDKIIASLVVGCVGCSFSFLTFCLLFFKYCKCRGCPVHDSGRLDENGTPLDQSTREQQQSLQIEQATPPVLEKRLSHLASMGNAGQLEVFPLRLLVQSTNNFCLDRKVGTGSFGSVYLGILDDGREVAIKRAEASSSNCYAVGTKRQEDKDNAFIHELESLSRLHHKNLVRLLGFCEDSNEMVLVYEFMGNGTLHDHLHKIQNSPLMSWVARIKVALDAARGIEYLHEYAVPPIIHRDIKPSNILVDAFWIAKVSDFGLSMMVPDDEDSHLSLRAAGTIGYVDPEYYVLQQLTTRSDVYSFGVVLLELLSGFKAIHKSENGTQRHVTEFVVPYILRDEIDGVLDSKVPQPTPYEIEALNHVGYLAADCVKPESQDRPSMSQVVNTLEKALVKCLVRRTSLSRSMTGSST